MGTSHRPTSLPHAVVALVVASAFMTGLAMPARGQEPTDLIVNGSFDDDTDPWWATGNLSIDVVDGQLCTEVPDGTINPWDAIVGQDNIALEEGESYQFSFTASASQPVGIRAIVQLPVDPFTAFTAINATLGPEPQGFTETFTAGESLPDAQVVFQVGGSAGPWTFCMDDVSLLTDAEPPVYEPDTGPRVRVNQVGYLPNGPKRATLVTEATEELPWQLTDASGAVVLRGRTTARGIDPSSEQNVHSIDFGSYTDAGEDYVLQADGEESFPFDISAGAYQQLRVDALSFYYPQRSGTEILGSVAGEDYARPAGHVGIAPNRGDTDVPCQEPQPFMDNWTCDYTLDVTGGWYDAGDHGKYVVNGGISVYQLMSAFERTKTAPTGDAEALDDGTLRVPEQGNGVPDILDEARWELEFMLKMQVPEGLPLAGMAHHKIHDNQWTGLPLMPHLDPEVRELHRPSTAATLNLAAVAAQGARLYAPYDRAFADQLLTAARTAWTAAEENPELYAPVEDGESGGGPYDDDDATDEFYWAAAELYITSGEQRFLDAVLASPHHTGDVFSPGGFHWGSVAALGRLDLATVPNGLPDRERVQQSVLDGADAYLVTEQGEGERQRAGGRGGKGEAYGHPYAPPDGFYVWGSNSQVLNNMVVMATAYDLSGETKYRDGVLEGMDYLLGRNALNQSYITGYGENDARNQHSRWYANQLNANLPNPPPGSIAGGPNSGIEDPVAQRLLAGCAAQFCYIDDIESWSTNEITINWNSTLSWVASFVADQGDAQDPSPPACEVEYIKHGTWPSGFNVQIWLTNTGASPIEGWELLWSFIGDQEINNIWGVSATQEGTTVRAENLHWNRTIEPGRSRTFGFIGKTGAGANPAPALFKLNGEPCSNAGGRWAQ